MSLMSTAARLPHDRTEPAPTPAAPVADYLSVSTGQIHRLSSSPEAGGGEPPLYALHATAYSGRTFGPLMRELPSRRVVALDAPGYGGSTRPEAPLTVPQYAQSLLEAVEAAGDRRIDLLGYHTGAFFALEMAMRRLDLVRRLVLIGVPFYPAGPAREERRQTLGAPMRLTEDLTQFEERWRFFVTQRPDGMTLAQGYAHFVDELRAYPYGFWAHQAAFTYDPEPALRAISQPVLILNPANHLAEPSRQAAALLRDVRLVELPQASHQVLDLAVTDLAPPIDDFLSR